MRLKGRQLKARVRELRQAAEVQGSLGLKGPAATATLGRTTSEALARFCLWVAGKGILIEDYEYEMQGAVARSIDELRARLEALSEAIPRTDPEQVAVAELREATRLFANRHNPGLDWHDFGSTLGEREWRALQRLRVTFAEVFLDWFDNKGLTEARAALARIPLDQDGRPGWLPPAEADRGL